MSQSRYVLHHQYYNDDVGDMVDSFLIQSHNNLLKMIMEGVCLMLLIGGEGESD